MALEPVHAQPATVKFTPPIKGPLRRDTHAYELMRQCIHCGFCLPTCPTYSVLGVEMDSPRGRIYQMQAVAEGRMEVSSDFIEHMNCCLGCRACETACPSGVQFGKLIEAAREQIQIDSYIIGTTQKAITTNTMQLSNIPASPLTSPAETVLRRLFFNLILPSRSATTLIFAGLKLYQRTGLQKMVHATGLLDTVDALPTPFQDKLKLPEELMPRVDGDLFPDPLPEITPALGNRRYRVGFISGCIMDQIFRDINEATIRVLAANGCEVITPQQQQCCGALHIHAGEGYSGRELARQNIDVFEKYECDAIIINSAGCGSNLKEYGHLLRDDRNYASRALAFSQKVKDISEFLASIELNHNMGELPYTVAYHDACHLAHGQKIRQQPRQLLQSIPGLKMVPLKEADWCCGSAGIYNITNQKMADTLLQRKMENIIATGADVIATGNPGCMMQIALGIQKRGLEMHVVHPVQLLDEAYRAKGFYNATLPVNSARQRQQRTLLIGIGIGLLIGLFLIRGRRRRK